MPALMELTDRRKQLAAEALEIIRKAEGDGARGRDLTVEESKRSDELYVEIEKLDKRIERASHVERLDDSPRLVKPHAIGTSSPGFDGGQRYGSVAPTATLNEVVHLRNSQGGSIPSFRGAASMARHYGYDSRALGQPGSFGRCIQALVSGNNEFLTPDERTEMRAINETIGHQGGWLVPSPVSVMFFDRLRNAVALTKLGATVVPMDSDTLKIPRQASAPTFVIHSENVTESTTDITFDAVELKASTVLAIVQVSEEWAADVTGGANLIEERLTKEMAAKLDYYGIAGTGSGEPLGVKNMPNIGSTSVGGSVDWDDLLTCVKTVRGQNVEPNGWIASSTNLDVLEKLKINGESNHYLPGPPGSMQRLELAPTEGVGDADVLVGDFSQAILGVRQRATVDVKPDIRSHSLYIKISARVGFNAKHQEAFCVATDIS